MRIVQCLVLNVGAGDTIGVLERFAEAGLVFLVMAIVIIFLYRAWQGEKKDKKAIAIEKDKIAVEYKNFLKENHVKQIETLTNMTTTMDAVVQKIIEINAKIR